MNIQQRKTQSAAPRFGRLDADLADVERAIVRSRNSCSLSSIPTGIGAANWKPIPCSKPTTSFCTPCSKAATPAAFTRTHRDDALPERGRQLEHLSRRPGQHLAFRQVLLLGQSWASAPAIPAWRSAASGCWSTAAWWSATPSPNVSLLAGRVRLRRGSGHSARDRPVSALVLFQYLRISSWSRSILVPLAIMYARKPLKRIPPSRASTSYTSAVAPTPGSACAWIANPSCPGAILHRSRQNPAFRRGGPHPPAAHSGLKKAEKWMLERLEMTDGLGAIYPAMLNAIIALRCLATPKTTRR